MKCIICHMDIIEGLDSYEKCNNDHIVHSDCLKEWLVQSLNCPLCSEKYSQSIIDKYEEYFKQKEQEKIDQYEEEANKEAMNMLKSLSKKFVFYKFIESVENLSEDEKYDEALERLEAYDDKDLETEKKHTLMFMRGKINFLRGRYDIAVGSLFKLVKEKYDYPEAFLYLGKSYEAIGLKEKAKWAFDRA